MLLTSPHPHRFITPNQDQAPFFGIPRPKPPEHRLWAPEPEKDHLDPGLVFEAGIRHHHLANTAYPIAHRKTIWKYRQQRQLIPELMVNGFADDLMSLYAHIPFCERRCRFCEYTVIETNDPEVQWDYHQALIRELDLYADLIHSEGKTLVGFDIGGGTPALIDPHLIDQLVDRVHQRFRLDPNFGISIETTPKIAATMPDRIRRLRESGIERISMGLQMVNPRLLKAYGREIHKVGYNHRAVEHIRRAGFRRFNIDLMYGFARQSVDDFIGTLKYTIDLSPDYITLYRMRYKGTRVADEASRVSLERVMEMYQAGVTLLGDNGYSVNPGKNGFSRIPDDPGTSEYLTARVVHSVPYLGIGLGAQTFTNNLLGYNLGAASKRLGAYLRHVRSGQLPVQDLYLLPKSEGMAKMISVSFYFGQIHLGAFYHRFGVPLESWFADELDFVLNQGLMAYNGDNVLGLTSKGAKVFNGVVALFYSDGVKRHLLSLEGGNDHGNAGV